MRNPGKLKGENKGPGTSPQDVPQSGVPVAHGRHSPVPLAHGTRREGEGRGGNGHTKSRTTPKAGPTAKKWPRKRKYAEREEKRREKGESAQGRDFPDPSSPHVQLDLQDSRRSEGRAQLPTAPNRGGNRAIQGSVCQNLCLLCLPFGQIWPYLNQKFVGTGVHLHKE